MEVIRKCANEFQKNLNWKFICVFINRIDCIVLTEHLNMGMENHNPDLYDQY